MPVRRHTLILVLFALVIAPSASAGFFESCSVKLARLRKSISRALDSGRAKQFVQAKEQRKKINEERFERKWMTRKQEIDAQLAPRIRHLTEDLAERLRDHAGKLNAEAATSGEPRPRILAEILMEEAAPPARLKWLFKTQLPGLYSNARREGKNFDSVTSLQPRTVEAFLETSHVKAKLKERLHRHWEKTAEAQIPALKAEIPAEARRQAAKLKEDAEKDRDTFEKGKRRFDYLTMRALVRFAEDPTLLEPYLEKQIPDIENSAVQNQKLTAPDQAFFKVGRAAILNTKKIEEFAMEQAGKFKEEREIALRAGIPTLAATRSEALRKDIQRRRSRTEAANINHRMWLDMLDRETSPDKVAEFLNGKVEDFIKDQAQRGNWPELENLPHLTLDSLDRSKTLDSEHKAAVKAHWEALQIPLLNDYVPTVTRQYADDFRAQAEKKKQTSQTEKDRKNYLNATTLIRFSEDATRFEPWVRGQFDSIVASASRNQAVTPAEKAFAKPALKDIFQWESFKTLLVEETKIFDESVEQRLRAAIPNIVIALSAQLKKDIEVRKQRVSAGNVKGNIWMSILERETSDEKLTARFERQIDDIVAKATKKGGMVDPEQDLVRISIEKLDNDKDLQKELNTAVEAHWARIDGGILDALAPVIQKRADELHLQVAAHTKKLYDEALGEKNLEKFMLAQMLRNEVRTAEDFIWIFEENIKEKLQAARKKGEGITDAAAIPVSYSLDEFMKDQMKEVKLIEHRASARKYFDRFRKKIENLPALTQGQIRVLVDEEQNWAYLQFGPMSADDAKWAEHVFDGKDLHGVLLKASTGCADHSCSQARARGSEEVSQIRELREAQQQISSGTHKTGETKEGKRIIHSGTHAAAFDWLKLAAMGVFRNEERVRIPVPSILVPTGAGAGEATLTPKVERQDGGDVLYIGD